MPFRTMFVKTIAAAGLFALALVGCDIYPSEREDCEGYPYVVQNVLPDTVTLFVGGPGVTFDLNAVFRHSAGKRLSFRAFSDRSTASTVLGGPAGTTLDLKPTDAGTTRLELWAEDECEKWDTVGTIVQVTDSLNKLSRP